MTKLVYGDDNERHTDALLIIMYDVFSDVVVWVDDCGVQ